MKQSKKFYKISAALLTALAFSIFGIVFGALLTGCGKTRDNFAMLTRADAFNIRQVITGDSTTSRTVMWQSETEEKDAFVEYREVKDKNTSSQIKTITEKERINDKFTDNGKTTWVHTVTLKNLQPGAGYEYRLGWKDRRSAWYPLAAAGGDSYKALIFPDSQSADYKSWEKVAVPAWQRHPDARFFIAMGDLVDNGEHAYQWNEWFTRIQSMVTQIPAAPLLGNHETYTADWKVRMPLAYLHYFTLPEGAPEAYKNQFYSFDFGEVHYTVLNTQMREMKQFQPDLLKDQVAWFKSDMEKTKKKWKVVLMHRDVLQYKFQTRKSSRKEGFSEEGMLFMPLFDKYNVDVVLSAHLHTYRNRGHIYDFDRNAKGPLYILTGVAGDVRYPNLWKRHALDVVLAPQPETNNYMVLEADRDKLKLTCYLPDGRIIDEAEIRK